MAEPDPNTPQVVDPERVVDLTRLLQIRGPLGVLNVLDTIVPVVNMGDVVARTVTVLQPSYRSTDVFSEGVLLNSGPNALMADTGPLAEGIYDILLAAEATNIADNRDAFVLEHRDAANSANLATWAQLAISDATVSRVASQMNPFAYEFALNERLRLIWGGTSPVGFTVNGVIFARRRA